MHLWSQKIFKEIGELCGRWIATEEETELKNHIKWARIEITGDGRNIPLEVVIERDGVKFFIPIWAKKQTRFGLGLPESPEKNSQRVVEHVGCSKSGFEFNEEARAKHADGVVEGNLLDSFRDRPVTTIGPDFSAQVIFNDIQQSPTVDMKFDCCLEELKAAFNANQNTSLNTQPSHVEETERMASYTGNSIICIGPEVEIGTEIQEDKVEDAMAITSVGEDQSNVESGQQQQLIQLNSGINDEDCRVEDAIPISV